MKWRLLIDNEGYWYDEFMKKKMIDYRYNWLGSHSKGYYGWDERGAYIKWQLSMGGRAHL